MCIEEIIMLGRGFLLNRSSTKACYSFFAATLFPLRGYVGFLLLWFEGFDLVDFLITNYRFQVKI